jgi:uncharacterized protein involved in exopolysaccharide biosynthesis
VRRALRSLAIVFVLAATVFVYRSAVTTIRYTAEATVELATAESSTGAAVPQLAALATPHSGASVDVIPVPATRFVVIRGVAADPDQAAGVANDVAHAYVRQSQSAVAASAARALAALHADEAQARAVIDTLEAQVASLEPTPGADPILARRAILDHARTAGLRARSEAVYRQVVAAATPDAVPAIAGDQLVVALKDQVNKLTVYRADLVRENGPASQIADVDLAMATTRAQLRDTEARLAREIRQDYEAMASREQAVSQQVASFTAQTAASASRLDRASQLFSALSAGRDRLAGLQARQRELAAAATADSGATVVTPAPIPSSVTPDAARAGLSLLLGGMLFAASFVRRPSRRRYTPAPPSTYAHFRVRRHVAAQSAPRRRHAA